MDELTLRSLESRRVAWKFEWESLLRCEPSVSALGNPDTLIYKMDEVISALLATLQRECGATTVAKALLIPLERHCACRLNPLSKFYATGELALRATASILSAADRELMLARFRLQGIDEIENLCSVCQSRLKPGFPAAGSQDWASRCGSFRGA